jgi:hypothetical protein
MVAVREQNTKLIKGIARGLLSEEVPVLAVVAVVVAPAAMLTGYQRT